MKKLTKNEVYLEDLVPYLDNFLVKLNHDFLKQLMLNSSNSQKPWRNKEFVEYIGYTYNQKIGASSALSAVFREGRSLHLSVIKKMINISTFNWKDTQNNLISIRAGRNRQGLKINFPIYIDQKLGQIIGHILA